MTKKKTCKNKKNRYTMFCIKHETYFKVDDKNVVYYIIILPMHDRSVKYISLL